jgi:hypothetical protein
LGEEHPVLDEDRLSIDVRDGTALFRSAKLAKAGVVWCFDLAIICRG